jgi:putative peptide zinc metalloprotease protein
MGAGIYLVYPAFYTDVSDNYRLKRWARVRTDLGGFYFNLIFALGVMGLYFLTGHEFLLLVVTLTVLEIVHQLMPFVRLDGYWTLADVTGVPDFFSQMAAYVRSILPFAKLEGRKLPELKWWAKAVFGLYMLITLPLLAFLLFGMIRGLPRILATAWDAFQQQLAAFGQAQAAGQVVGMAGAAVQVLVLALPTLGIIYTLFNLARRLLTAVWNWSKPTPQRRLIGSVGTLGAVGLIAYLWAPQIPFGGGQSGPGYRHYQESFRPLTRDDRGTVFDIAGAPPPAWLPAPSPTPAAEPTATVSPSPEGTAQPAGTAQPTPAGTPAPPLATTPTVAVTAVPTIAPTAPAAPKAAPAPALAPTAPPSPAPTSRAPPANPAPPAGGGPGFVGPSGATATPGGPLRP